MMHVGTRARDVGPPGERGATSVEYALLMTLIAIGIIGAVALFGDAVQGLFDFEFPGG